MTVSPIYVNTLTSSYGDVQRIFRLLGDNIEVKVS